MAAETKDERRARLEAELAEIDKESREEAINQAVSDVSLHDVIGHLVQHSAGYPTNDDREVHARAVRKHYGTGEYAEDSATDGQDK